MTRALSTNAEIPWRPLTRAGGATTSGYGLAAIVSARGRELASSAAAQGASWYDLYAQTGGYLQISLEGTVSTGSSGTSTPAADATSAAAASADGGTTVELFWRTSSRAVGSRAWNGTSFVDLGQPRTGAFLAGLGAAGTTNRIDLFGVGTDHMLWHGGRNGTAWWGWTNELGAPPNLTLASVPPAVVWRPDGVLHVFVLATDGAIWTQRYQNGWSGWVSLGGGFFGSGVAVALTGTNRLDVFAASGSDGTIYRKYSTDGGDTWILTGGFWESLGKPARGNLQVLIDGVLRYVAPTAVSWGGGEVDVYVRDASGAIQTATLGLSNDCQRVADEFGILPNNTWTFAPVEIQQWWMRNGCTATDTASTNQCQKASDIYGITSTGGSTNFGYAPTSVSAWWNSNLCSGSPQVSESLCQRASDTYGIVANNTFGTAPGYVIDWWGANNCWTSPHGLSACQKAADFFGTFAFQTWAAAPNDVRVFWGSNNCNAIAPTPNVSTVQVCQNVANLYAMSAGSPGGAPAEVQAWFNANCGGTAPTCQGLSDTFGAKHTVTWGYADWPASPAPVYIQSWWIQHNCTTAPEFSNDTCQRASNTFGITAGQTFGFAPGFVQTWWTATGCTTSPQPALFLPAAKPFSPATVSNTCTFNPATMVPQRLGDFAMSGTFNGTIVNDVSLGTFPAGTTVIVGFSGLNNPAVQGDTYLRLIDSGRGEVASNDDACGTYGSRIVYTVPSGAATLWARLGCYQNESCQGTLNLWSRLDSNGYSKDIVAAFQKISAGVPALSASLPGNPNGDALSSSFANPSSSVASLSYLKCGQIKDACKSHFQGVARLPIPGLGNVLALAGSDQGDLLLLKDFGATSNATGSWHDHWSGQPNSSQSEFIYHKSFVENTSRDGFMPHISGLQAIGQYLATVTQAPDDLDINFNVINGNGSSVNRIFRVNQNPLSIDVPVRWESNFTYSAYYGSCAAANKTADGGYLFAVADASSTHVQFYRLDPDQATTVWNTGSAAGPILRGFADIESPSWAQAAPRTMDMTPVSYLFNGFQNCNLFSQTDGTVWLAGTKGSVATLGQVDLTDPNQPKIFTAPSHPLPRQEFFPDGIDLSDSAGLFQDATLDLIYLYTTSKYLTWGGPPPGSQTPKSWLNYVEFGSSMLLSQNQPTAQSSTAAGGASSLALDLIGATFSSTLPELAPWWYVDLGSPKRVQAVSVSRRRDLTSSSSFLVYGSTNLSTWTQLGDVNGNWSWNLVGSSASAQIYLNPFNSNGTSTAYRYIKIVQPNAPAAPLQLSEVGVAGD